MAILGTTTADSDFYQRKAAQTGQVLGMFMGALDQRRQEKERREKEEIAIAFKAMQDSPQIAASWGTELVKKYGSKYPELSPLVAMYREKAELARAVPEAGKLWESELEKLEAGYGAKQEAYATMPDFAPVPVATGPIPSFLTLPNPEKAKLAEELGSVSPALFPLMAAQNLPPRQRHLARAYAKSIPGYEMPTAFDPFEDLPPQIKAVLAAQMGLVTGETAQASRIGAELETSPYEIGKRAYETSERVGRERHTNEHREDEQKHSLDYLLKSDSLTRSRNDHQTANQIKVIDHRESASGGGEGENKGQGKRTLAVNPKDIADQGTDASQTWDKLWQQKSQASGTASDVGKKSKARDEFLQNNGFRPTVPSTSARAIATRLNKAVDAGLMDEEEAQRESVRLTSRYMHLTSNLQGRLTHPQALDRVLGEIPGGAVGPASPPAKSRTPPPQPGRPAAKPPEPKRPQPGSARAPAAAPKLTAEQAAAEFRKELKARHPTATPEQIEQKVDAAMTIWQSRQGGSG